MAYSHFRGVVQGNRGEAKRDGTLDSGMVTYCASMKGAIKVSAYVDDKGRDRVRVEKQPWYGVGKSMLIYNGPID